MSPSGEHKTRAEVLSFVHILAVDCASEDTNIPEEILLKDAFASDAEFRAQRIQTRFGRVSLPTAVKDGHRGIINHGDLVAVEIHSRHTAVGNNLGVSR